MNSISVNDLAKSSSLELPREIKLFLAKKVLAETRDGDEALKQFNQVVNKLSIDKQKKVINATGTLLHTNLGRAPSNLLFPGGYTNVEFDLLESKRGMRSIYLKTSMKTLLNTEDVTFVNNNASSLFVTLASLKKIHNKSHVIVSRGEIIEIGGSYRLPEIINETGLVLIEVGTTNKTRIKDYEDALKKYDNAVILKVHRSNFSITGFTEETTIAQLKELKDSYQTMLIHDLGSGLVIDRGFLSKYDLHIFDTEPRVQDSLDSGSDLVLFSGDKLFGSVQSGIIAGNKNIIESINGFSLYRTYRCSPIILFELQETTDKYLSKNEIEIPFWHLVSTPYSSLEERLSTIVSNCNVQYDIVRGESVIGGGTLPDKTLESPLLIFNENSVKDLMFKFLNNVFPIIPRIFNGKLSLDIRSVSIDEDKYIADFITSL